MLIKCCILFNSYSKFKLSKKFYFISCTKIAWDKYTQKKKIKILKKKFYLIEL